MRALIDNLEQAIRQHVLAQLPPDASGKLAAMDVDELLVVYGSWRSRLIPARPRQPYLSNELRASSKFAEHRPAVDSLLAAITSGDDLTPHLSTATRIAYQPVASNVRRDKDELLAEWGIHHLHLSTEMRRNGFVRRGPDVLFAAFRSDDAYLIGIYPHEADGGNWSSKEILRIVVRNWPAAGILLDLPGIDLKHDWDDEDRRSLRKAGVSGPIKIDGKVYSPRWGQAVDGTPSEVGRRVMALMWELRSWRERPVEHLEDLLVDRIGSEAVRMPPDAAWRPLVHNERCGFAKGDMFIAFGQLS